MKVLMIDGSPHSSGNTAIALREMEKGSCVFDDVVKEAALKFQECDGLAVGSPVYYASANATLIAFLTKP